MSKLLIVDTDEAYLKAASARLEGEHHVVDTCSHPKEVPAKVVSGNYDMLLIDLDLPGLNVGDLLALLRHMPTFRQTRVILLSRSDDDHRHATAREYECEYHVKTADNAALLGLVRHSFASRPPGLPKE